MILIGFLSMLKELTPKESKNAGLSLLSFFWIFLLTNLYCKTEMTYFEVIVLVPLLAECD